MKLNSLILAPVTYTTGATAIQASIQRSDGVWFSVRPNGRNASIPTIMSCTRVFRDDDGDAFLFAKRHYESHRPRARMTQSQSRRLDQESLLILAALERRWDQIRNGAIYHDETKTDPEVIHLTDGLTPTQRAAFYAIEPEIHEADTGYEGITSPDDPRTE